MGFPAGIARPWKANNPMHKNTPCTPGQIQHPGHPGALCTLAHTQHPALTPVPLHEHQRTLTQCTHLQHLSAGRALIHPRTSRTHGRGRGQRREAPNPQGPARPPPAPPRPGPNPSPGGRPPRRCPAPAAPRRPGPRPAARPPAHLAQRRPRSPRTGAHPGTPRTPLPQRAQRHCSRATSQGRASPGARALGADSPPCALKPAMAPLGYLLVLCSLKQALGSYPIWW